MRLKNYLLFPLLILILAISFRVGGEFASEKDTGEVLAAGSVEKYNFLSAQRSNQCGLQAADLNNYSDDASLQGSCCGAMDLHRYQEQVEGLEKYSGYDVVPEDPYDVSITLAKELFEYQKTITLSEGQQKTYNGAMEMSHEGGPCCCRCWRWHAFEGQAKYLISMDGFSSEQIAELWDLQDGCGGASHSGHS